MNEPAFDVVKWVMEEERKRVIQNPPPPQPPRERPTIHWTELKEEVSGRAGATDWNHYVKQVGRLLAVESPDRSLELDLALAPVIELDPPPERWPDPEAYLEVEE